MQSNGKDVIIKIKEEVSSKCKYEGQTHVLGIAVITLR
jgi:hypothetical protein